MPLSSSVEGVHSKGDHIRDRVTSFLVRDQCVSS